MTSSQQVRAARILLVVGVLVVLWGSLFGTHSPTQSVALLVGIVVAGAAAAVLGMVAGRLMVTVAAIPLACLGVPAVLTLAYLLAGV